MPQCHATIIITYKIITHSWTHQPSPLRALSQPVTSACLAATFLDEDGQHHLPLRNDLKAKIHKGTRYYTLHQLAPWSPKEQLGTRAALHKEDCTVVEEKYMTGAIHSQSQRFIHLFANIFERQTLESMLCGVRLLCKMGFQLLCFMKTTGSLAGKTKTQSVPRKRFSGEFHYTPPLYKSLLYADTHMLTSASSHSEFNTHTNLPHIAHYM